MSYKFDAQNNKLCQVLLSDLIVMSIFANVCAKSVSYV